MLIDTSIKVEWEESGPGRRVARVDNGLGEIVNIGDIKYQDGSYIWLCYSNSRGLSGGGPAWSECEAKRRVILGYLHACMSVALKKRRDL